MINVTSRNLPLGRKKEKTFFNLKLLSFCKIKDKQVVPGIYALMNARILSYSMHTNAAQDLLYAPFFFFFV